MSTTIQPAMNAQEAERRFFLGMALLLIATAAFGFGGFVLTGNSSFNAPWWVHVHAVTMVGWLCFFALQNTLVVKGNLGLHRKLGTFGAIFGAWIIISGIMVGIGVVATGRNAPHTPPEMLAIAWMNVAGFTVLFLSALWLRSRTDWHKRLMLCALICVSAPAFGRTLVLLESRTHVNFSLFILGFMVIGALGDLVIHKRVHPSYFWGLGTAIVTTSLIALLPKLSSFESFALSFVR